MYFLDVYWYLIMDYVFNGHIIQETLKTVRFKRFNLPTSFSTKPFIAVGSDTGGGNYSFGFEVYISYTTIYSPNSKYGVFCIFIGT